MKKSLIAVLAVLCMASCSKEYSVPENQGSVVTINASLPATRVSVDTDGKVCWTANDAIAVYSADGGKFKFTVSEGAGSNYASFTCSDFVGELGSVAVYPYDFVGDAPGKITVPAIIPLGAEPQPVMASVITPEEGELMAGSVYFNHLMGMMEFVFEDIPAYACGLKLWTNSCCISGEMSFDPANPGQIDALAASSEESNKDMYIISFPYKTGYGSGVTTRFYAPLPVADYSDLKIRFLDGDGDVIEGTAINVPAASSRIAAADYVAMPSLNVREKVGSARDMFTKVQKVKWAKSNLRAMSADAGAADKEGWQKSWGLYDNPWETQVGIVYPYSTLSGDQKNGISLNQDRFKKGGYYSHFDYFSWGTIGRAARVHNAKVTSSVAEFSICGKVFRGTASTGGNISTFTELEGDERFADESALNGSNSTMYGDLAFWASKGQYRLPTKEEIVSLYTKDGSLVKGRANLQAGHYRYRLEGDDGDRIMKGILYTTVPFWKADGLPSNNVTDVEFTDADIESGVFFPKNGERTTNTDGTYDATSTFAFNAWGVYWSGCYGGRNGSGYDDCARCIGWTGGNVTNYGYTVKLSNSIIGNTAIGNCIRPVYIGK